MLIFSPLSRYDYVNLISNERSTIHLIFAVHTNNENMMAAIKSHLGPLDCYRHQLSEIFEDFTIVDSENILISDSDLVRFKLLIAS